MQQSTSKAIDCETMAQHELTSFDYNNFHYLIIATGEPFDLIQVLLWRRRAFQFPSDEFFSDWPTGKKASHLKVTCTFARD